jgi:tetratricopeptide (TPR) repeat protein
MRYGLPVVIVTICGLAPAAAQYAGQAGMSADTTRRLNQTYEMGQQSKGKKEDTTRSLSFEESDDPTVTGQAVPRHEPLRAARKAAEKAAGLAKKNRREEAVAEYREAVAIDPLYYEAWNNLALELEAAGQADEAAQTFRQLMQKTPEHVLAFTNLAAMLSRQHHYAEAEAVARQAMKMHNYSYKANYTLGVVLVDQGKWDDEAKTKLEYAQMRYPEAKTLLSKWPVKAAAN